jgi:hypothetical protein
MEIKRVCVDTAYEVLPVDKYFDWWLRRLMRRFPGARPLADPATRAYVGGKAECRVLHKYSAPYIYGELKAERYPLCNVFDDGALAKRFTEIISQPYLQKPYRTLDQLYERIRRVVACEELHLRRHAAATVFGLVIDTSHDPILFDGRGDRDHRALRTVVTYFPPPRHTYVVRVSDDSIDLAMQETYYYEYLYVSFDREQDHYKLD